MLTTMVAARSRTVSVGIGQRSWMACLTRPTHFLKNFLSTQDSPPTLAVVDAKDVEVDQGGAVEDSVGGVVSRE